MYLHQIGLMESDTIPVSSLCCLLEVGFGCPKRRRLVSAWWREAKEARLDRNDGHPNRAETMRSGTGNNGPCAYQSECLDADIGRHAPDHVRCIHSLVQPPRETMSFPRRALDGIRFEHPRLKRRCGSSGELMLHHHPLLHARSTRLVAPLQAPSSNYINEVLSSTFHNRMS